LAQSWAEGARSKIVRYQVLLADLQAKPKEWWARYLRSVDENLGPYFYVLDLKSMGKTPKTAGGLGEAFEQALSAGIKKVEDKSKVTALEERKKTMVQLDADIQKFQAELNGLQ